MTFLSEPYMHATEIAKRLVLREIDCLLRVRPGNYDVRVGDESVEMYAVENRITTGGPPIRAMEIHALGAAAEPLVVLESDLRVSGGPLRMEDMDRRIFEVSFKRLMSTLYLFGDFQAESNEEEFPFRIKLPGDDEIRGYAMDEDWRGKRALAIRNLHSDDDVAVIRAVVAHESVVIERIPWA